MHVQGRLFSSKVSGRLRGPQSCHLHHLQSERKWHSLRSLIGLCSLVGLHGNSQQPVLSCHPLSQCLSSVTCLGLSVMFSQRLMSYSLTLWSLTSATMSWTPHIPSLWMHQILYIRYCTWEWSFWSHTWWAHWRIKSYPSGVRGLSALENL